MKRARVVHVTTTDMSLALLLGPQLRALSDAGYEVIGMSAPGPFVAGLEADGIRHVPLRHATRAMAPGRDLLALRELYRQFRTLQPEIVHTHNPKPGVYGRLAARAARVPCVVNTVHGLYATPADDWRRRAVVYGLERAAAAFSHAELVQNPEDVAVLRRLGVPARKLVLLGNGIDLERFELGHRPPDVRAAVRAELGIGPHEVVCLAVGRLVREKGYPELFDAVARLALTHPALRLVVAGPADPDKPDALTGQVVDRAADAGVRFLGMVDDIERLYAAADIFVLASHREGFPRAAMEAAAMGLPVVATAIRGCRQVVDDGVTGALVPVGDVGALADAIARLADDDEERRTMGCAGRAKARREFDQRRVIGTTLDVYDRLLGGTQHGARSRVVPA